MRYNEIGINVDSIDKLILDIYSYAEKINKTLNEIASIVDDTKAFYQGENATNYRRKFDDFKTNFPIIDGNLKGYADDLIKLKNRYKNIDVNLTNTIKNATTNMQNRNY